MPALIKRELRIAMRAGGHAFGGLLFFLCVVVVFAFAIGPDLNQLARLGPVLLWLGALLASLLGLERLFQQDYDDGSLDILLLQSGGDIADLGIIVFTKALAHWLASGLPLVLAAPLFSLMLNVEPLGIAALVGSLFVGTPAIAFIGTMGAAVTVSLPRGGLLIAVLILPLIIPVLIFGVAATTGALVDTAPFLQPFLLLCAITLFSSIIGPFAAAMMLRRSEK